MIFFFRLKPKLKLKQEYWQFDIYTNPELIKERKEEEKEEIILLMHDVIFDLQELYYYY